MQSGNVIFRIKEKILACADEEDPECNRAQIRLRPEIILRTTDELRKAIAATPFPASRGLEPGKILVTFLAAEPGPEAHATLLKLKNHPEEMHLKGRELYIYFPDGAGTSKLPWSCIAEALKTQGTARNWNSVTKILAIAEELEKSAGVIFASDPQTEKLRIHRKAELNGLVGTGRFELPTPRTPSECSTRLSHVPTRKDSADADGRLQATVSLQRRGSLNNSTLPRRMQTCLGRSETS